MTDKASGYNILLSISITLLALSIFMFSFELKRTRDETALLLPALNDMLLMIDTALDQHLEDVLVEVRATREMVPGVLDRIDNQLSHVDQQLLNAQDIAGSASTDAASGAVKGVAKGIFYELPKAVITAPSKAYKNYNSKDEVQEE